MYMKIMNNKNLSLFQMLLNFKSKTVSENVSLELRIDEENLKNPIHKPQQNKT